MSKKYEYDAIIIGAGISGLVCGCYLVKAGIKTLIIDQHSTPGGYCASFKRNGYNFDAAVHYIGGVRRGSLAKILSELEINDTLKFNQFDPTDKIIIPNAVAYFRADPRDTIDEFKKSFPREKKQIDDFFKLMMSSNTNAVYREVMNLTFKDILDRFFTNENLKSILALIRLIRIFKSVTKSLSGSCEHFRILDKKSSFI